MFGLVRIDSRFGNVIVAVLGVIYAIAALALLAYYVVAVWGAESLMDRALQLCLLIAVFAGVGFVLIGRANLQRRHA